MNEFVFISIDLLILAAAFLAGNAAVRRAPEKTLPAYLTGAAIIPDFKRKFADFIEAWDGLAIRAVKAERRGGK